LADAGRSEGALIQVDEAIFKRTNLPLYYRFDFYEGYVLDTVAEHLQLFYQFRRHQFLTCTHDLTKFDEYRAQLLQREAKTSVYVGCRQTWSVFVTPLIYASGDHVA